jgi:hypothetical protein
MKRMQIFKTGTHTSANGVTLDFNETTIKQAIAAYDPAVHEAPIVVGHPKDNHPAYGWIKSVDFEDGAIVAEPHQLDPAKALSYMTFIQIVANNEEGMVHTHNTRNQQACWLVILC